MSAQLSVQMTADEADLFAKLTTLIAKTAESEAAFKRVTDSSGQAAQATKEAAAQAEAVARATANAAKEQDNFAAAGKRLSDQLIRANETLSESYERQQSQLKAAFDAGRLGATEYEKSLSLLKTRSDEMQAAQEKAALESSEAYKVARKEAEEGRKLTDQLIRANETLEQVYKRQETQVKAAFDAGKISAEEYSDSIRALKTQYEESSAAQARAALESTEAFQKNRREVEAGVSTVDRLRVANTSLEDKYKQLAVEVKRAHDAGKISAEEHAEAIKQLDKEYEEQKNAQNKTLGQEFLGKVTGAIAGWVSIGAAVAAVTEAIAMQNEEIERGLAIVRGTDEPNRDLASVSSSEKELVERIQQSELIQRREGLAADQASALVFALDSQGLIGTDKDVTENDRVTELFGRVNRVTDAPTMVNVAGLFSQTFGTDAAAAVNIALASAEKSKFTPQQMAGHLVAAAAGAGEFKEADQDQVAIETAAIVAGLANTKDAMAGTMAKTALAKLAQQFPSSTPMEATRSALAMTPEDRQAAFGDNEQVKFFLSELGSRMGTFEEIVGSVGAAAAGTGTDRDRLEQIIRIREKADPNSVLVRNEKRSERMRDLAAASMDAVAIQQGNAYYRNRREAQISQGQGDLGFLPQWAERFIWNRLDWDDTLGVDRGRVLGNRDTQNQIRSELDNEREAAADRRNNELKEVLRQNQLPPVTRPGDDR